ncbi:hypothetical protein GQ42DRAFT_145958 [Ramicandelaber brevisporus]|nr:hypothetical protein GQ42DRAFT_145958 [Ramicandelaber brevisporus]
MSDSAVTIRTRKFISNPLLQRRQCVIEITHPGRPNVSRADLREKLGKLYKAEPANVSVFGLRTDFGGGKSKGFALIYDSAESFKTFEPKYRQLRNEGKTIERTLRKQRKERKNRAKKFFGTAKSKAATAAKGKK